MLFIYGDMKILWLLILVLFTINERVSAQNPDGQMSEITFGSRAITQFNEELPAEGSYFISDEWQNGWIKLNSGEIFKNILLKYNLDQSVLFFKQKSAVRTFSVKKLEAFGWENEDKKTQEFINNKELRALQNQLYELIIKEDISLYARYSTKIIKSDYNEVLAVGDKLDKIVIEKTYYYFFKNKLTLIPNSRKKVLESIAAKYHADLAKYMKEERLKFKEESDFVSFVTKWNQLIIDKD